MAAEQVVPLSSIPFDFWSAFVAAGFGFLSGTVASLVAPWVHYFIEKRRKGIEYKEKLISNARFLLDKSESITDIKKSSLWGFIESHLTSDEKNLVMPVRTFIVQADDGAEIPEDDRRKQVVSCMLSRLEKEWHLTK